MKNKEKIIAVSKLLIVLSFAAIGILAVVNELSKPNPKSAVKVNENFADDFVEDFAEKLGGQSNTDTEQASSGVSTFESYQGFGESGKVSVFIDPETGIEYLLYREKVGYAGMGGITPRLNPDGSIKIHDKGE